MSSRLLFVPLVIALTLGVASRAGVGVSAQSAPPSVATSTLDDQAELAVTVYNSDLALVRDVRNIQIARGRSDLHFMDIAATVNPATVHFRSLTEPSRVERARAELRIRPARARKTAAKYVGREVTLVRLRRDGNTTREEEVKARLLSYNNAPVWRNRRRNRHRHAADHIRFPELPGNLFSRPTLIWTLENNGGTRHRVEASYLARKLSWNADYVLTVRATTRAADLDGWVTVDQRQRHVVQERQAAARRGRLESRSAGDRQNA